MTLIISYKKSILISIGFLYFITSTTAQNGERITALINENNLLQAKEAIDSFIISNEPSAKKYWLQAKVYNALAKDPGLKSVTPDANAVAFNALQSAAAIDKAFLDNILQETNYQITTDIYDMYTNDGLLFYNAGVERNDKNSFAESLVNFKKAGAVKAFLHNSGWNKQSADTLNFIYKAKSAIYADNEIDALINCKIIVDSNYSSKALQNTCESIYKWLPYYFKLNKQEEQFYKYAEIGAAKYPKSEYYSLLKIDWLREQKRYPELLASYRQIFQLQPQNQKYRIAYLNDIYNYLYHDKTNQNDKAAYAIKLEKGLRKQILTKQDLINTRLLLAKHYTNQASALSKETMLRSTTNKKVLNDYKVKQINLLTKANIQLKSLPTKPKTKVYEEAIGLLKSNYVIIDLLRKR